MNSRPRSALDCDRFADGRKRVMLVYGTRPEAVKMAPVVHALMESDHFTPLVAVTGQHRSMLDQINQLFEIVPGVDLDIHQPGQTLAEITARAMTGLYPVMAQHCPDLVVVQGDTTTTFVAALAAFYAQIPVAHLEAGLRTHDRYSPFPEEINRQLTTRLTTLHLAPTEMSANNLLREGVDPDSITVTGNTVIDALLWAVSHPRAYENAALDEMQAVPFFWSRLTAGNRSVRRCARSGMLWRSSRGCSPASSSSSRSIAIRSSAKRFCRQSNTCRT